MCVNTTLRSCLHSVSTPLQTTVHTCVNTTFDVSSHLISPKFRCAPRTEPPIFFALRAEDAYTNPYPYPYPYAVRPSTQSARAHSPPEHTVRATIKAECALLQGI